MFSARRKRNEAKPLNPPMSGVAQCTASNVAPWGGHANPPPRPWTAGTGTSLKRHVKNDPGDKKSPATVKYVPPVEGPSVGVMDATPEFVKNQPPPPHGKKRWRRRLRRRG
jgi:hypothetical protein